MSDAAHSKGTIVFIDDDEGPMELYVEALQDAGYAVKRIRKLVEALDYIWNTPAEPALWLVDVMMPVIDESARVDGVLLSTAASQGLGSGRVLYQQIRKRFPTTPVILVTSVTTPKILQSLEAEMDERAVCEAKIAVLPSDMVALVERMIGGK